MQNTEEPGLTKPKTVEEFYDSPKVWEEYFDEEVIYDCIPYASCSSVDEIEFSEIKIAKHETFSYSRDYEWFGQKRKHCEFKTLKSVWFKGIPVAVWYIYSDTEDILDSQIYVTDLAAHKEMVEYIRSLLPTREPDEIDNETFTKLMELYDEEA